MEKEEKPFEPGPVGQGSGLPLIEKLFGERADGDFVHRPEAVNKSVRRVS
jgi:hypothetical protein